MSKSRRQSVAEPLVSHPECFFQSVEFSNACTSRLHCMQPYACLGERGKLVFSFQLFLFIIQNQLVDLVFEWFLQEMASSPKN